MGVLPPGGVLGVPRVPDHHSFHRCSSGLDRTRDQDRAKHAVDLRDLLLPLVGPIAYVAVEILPGLFGGRTARRARSGMQRMIDPDRDLRRASAEVEISGNVDARRRLAEELLERRQFDAAIQAYEGGLTGIFEHDPTLLAGLARAQFAKSDFAGSRATLERLLQHNPDFKSPEIAVAACAHARGAGRLRGGGTRL